MGEAKDPIENNALAQILHDEEEDYDNGKVRKKLKRMLKDHKTLLYPNCKQGYKKLGSTLELL